MSLKISVIRKSDQVVGAWSGGTTTQLAIWPSWADYKERNFLWRISTARVDLEESTFTSLPGYHRLLMILEGNVHLEHEKRREVDLGPFGQDAFEGDWTTRSRGRCVDFNLMAAAGWAGSLEAVGSHEGEVKLFGSRPRGKNMAEAFYCLVPQLTFTLRAETPLETECERGDFLMIQSDGAADEAVYTLSAYSADAGIPCGIRVRVGPCQDGDAL